MRSSASQLRLALPVGLCVVAACALLGVPEDRILFPHAVHRDEADCADCHAGIEASTSLDSRFLPAKPACAECHDEVEDAAACGTCHAEPAHAAGFAGARPARLRFSHASHMEPAKRQCLGCHRLADAGTAGSTHGFTPLDHDRCEGCHRADLDALRCTRCHTSLAAYSGGPDLLYRHGDGYVNRHAREARSGTDTCAQCHDQTFCADCHGRTAPRRLSLRFPERVDRGFIHRGDWVGAHPAEASNRRTQCLRCHGPAFCDSCHERYGVGGHVRPSLDRPHPEGWLRPAGAASPHGRAARRDIVRCAACHDQGPLSNCVECHRSGGVPPHPPGWDRDGATSNPTCLICHGY